MVARRSRTISRLIIVGVLLLAPLATAVAAASLKSDLKVYVEKLRAMYSEAEITGSFYDWRTLSIYRSHAGLHLGYDIALNAGRAVPAGWPGTVMAVTPWTDTEYGVTVEVVRGYRVTYGHLHPSVHEGEVVRAGTYVGTVARDHVDIKVRDISGGYLDWGNTYGVLDGSGPWSPGGVALLPPPSAGGMGLGVEALLDNYRVAARRAAVCKMSRDHVADLVSSLGRYIERESNGLPQAEQQMLAWYRAADDHQVTEAQAEAQGLTVRARRTRVNRLTYMMIGRQRDLEEKEAVYRSVRASADAAREAAQKAGATEERLTRITEECRAKGRLDTATAAWPELERKIAEARVRCQYMRERYAQYGAARTQLEEAERDYERLCLVEALWKHGNKDDAQALNW